MGLHEEQLRFLSENGYVLIPGATTEEIVRKFLIEAERLSSETPDQAHGVRDLFRRSPRIANWAASRQVLSYLPPEYVPVRGILFDKTPAANWKVAWHQDLTIAVRKKVDIEGYGPWSVKETIPHVQPPMAVLDAMMTLRLHLDETPAENGALRVIPCSHIRGRLSAEEITQQRSQNKEVICAAQAGDILLMKPKLLHASASAQRAGHRRVIHVEYANRNILHADLEWHMH